MLENWGFSPLENPTLRGQLIKRRWFRKTNPEFPWERAICDDHKTIKETAKQKSNIDFSESHWKSVGVQHQ